MNKVFRTYTLEKKCQKFDLLCKNVYRERSSFLLCFIWCIFLSLTQPNGIPFWRTGIARNPFPQCVLAHRLNSSHFGISSNILMSVLKNSPFFCTRTLKAKGSTVMVFTRHGALCYRPIMGDPLHKYLLTKVICNDANMSISTIFSPQKWKISNAAEKYGALFEFEAAGWISGHRGFHFLELSDIWTYHHGVFISGSDLCH